MCPPKPKVVAPPPPPPAAPPPPADTAGGFQSPSMTGNNPGGMAQRLRKGINSLRVDLAVPNIGGSGPYVP
jgi:hypothetical protein